MYVLMLLARRMDAVLNLISATVLWVDHGL